MGSAKEVTIVRFRYIKKLKYCRIQFAHPRIDTEASLKVIPKGKL